MQHSERMREKEGSTSVIERKKEKKSESTQSAPQVLSVNGELWTSLLLGGFFGKSSLD